MGLIALLFECCISGAPGWRFPLQERNRMPDSDIAGALEVLCRGNERGPATWPSINARSALTMTAISIASCLYLFARTQVVVTSAIHGREGGAVQAAGHKIMSVLHPVAHSGRRLPRLRRRG